MAMKDRTQLEFGGKSLSLGSILPWVLIAILALVTAGWVVWAANQKEVRSSWTPD